MKNCPQLAFFRTTIQSRPIWILGLLLITLIASALTYQYWARPSAEPPDAASSEDPIQLRIQRTHPEGKDGLFLTVEARNAGKTPIGWDSDFAAFLHWRVTDANAKPVEFTRAWVVRPDRWLTKERFVLIAPGQSLIKEYDLERFIRIFEYDGVLPPAPEGMAGVYRHGVLVVREGKIRFHIPTPPNGVEVQLEFNSIDQRYGMMGTTKTAFLRSFGFEPEDVSLWIGKCQSNTIDLGD